MKTLEPSGGEILYAYLSGLVGAYAGGVLSLYLPDYPVVQTAGAGLGGITILLAVKALHYRAGVALLMVSLILPVVPLYYATIRDPYPSGQTLYVTRTVNLRAGPGLDFDPPLRTVGAGTPVVLLDRSWKRVHFDVQSGSYYNYWRLVKSASGIGWIYGGYLSEAPERG